MTGIASITTLVIPITVLYAEPVRFLCHDRPWTEADLLALADDERHYELVCGDLLMMSPASPAQGHYAACLIGALQLRSPGP